MADVIQRYLEDMVPELEDLEERGLISKVERISIVKKRTRFEYSIKRRQPHKIDFLRYIEYEVNLDSLVKKRRGRIEASEKQRAKLRKRGNNSGQRRIQLIFERAVRRFHGDVKLWIQYIEYTKQVNATRLLSQVLARALQLHPAKPQLWIYGAAWEFEENGNTIAARAMMQRGLRFNGDSQEMWLEYFRLELANVERIRRRRIVLGIEQSASTHTAVSKPENSSMAQDAEGEEEKTGDVLDRDMISLLPAAPQEETASEQQRELVERTTSAATDDSASAAFMDGLIAKIVFQCAIKEIPEDLSFRRLFLKVLSQFTGYTGVRTEVYESIEHDFSKVAEGRALLAERHLQGVNPDTVEYIAGLRQCVSEYQATITAINSSEIRECYVKFLLEQVHITKEDNITKYLVGSLSEAFEHAQHAQQCTPMLYQLWVQLLRDRLQNAQRANDIIAKATKQFPEDDQLWLLRLASLELKERLSTSHQALKLCSTSQPLWQCHLDTVEELWRNDVLDTDSVQQAYKDAVLDSMQARGSAQGNLANATDLCTAIQTRYLDWALQHTQLAGFRAAAQWIARTVPAGRAFYDRCIEVERKHGSPTDPACQQRINMHYEQVATLDVKHEDTWIAYIQWHLDAGRFRQAGDIYSKAARLLGDPAAFAARYQSLINTPNAS